MINGRRCTRVGETDSNQMIDVESVPYSIPRCFYCTSGRIFKYISDRNTDGIVTGQERTRHAQDSILAYGTSGPQPSVPANPNMASTPWAWRLRSRPSHQPLCQESVPVPSLPSGEGPDDHIRSGPSATPPTRKKPVHMSTVSSTAPPLSDVRKDNQLVNFDDFLSF